MKSVYHLAARYALSFYAPAQRFRIAEKICGGRPQELPGDMLVQIRQQGGRWALFVSDCILFGWCLLFSLLLDVLTLGALVRDIVGFLICLAAFCLCMDDRNRSFLKIGFLIFSFFCEDSWTLTCLIMIAFEHLSPTETSLNSRWTI